MLKFLLFLLPSFLFAEISSDLTWSCHQSDYSACAKVGSIRMDKSNPDYDPAHAVEPLKMACKYGNNSTSCNSLASYYISINDKHSYLSYLEIGCDLHDSTSCYLYHASGGK